MKDWYLQLSCIWLS